MACKQIQYTQAVVRRVKYRKLAFLNTFRSVKSRFEYGRFLLADMTRDVKNGEVNGWKGRRIRSRLFTARVVVAVALWEGEGPCWFGQIRV